MTTARHSDTENSPDHLQRKLSNRHLQLIAIGGAIGTGLFMGSGKTISRRSFNSLYLYDYWRNVLFLMRAMGELLLANLHYKSFVDMAHDLIGPWAGYYWVGPIG